jgi:dTDP-4-dehydrorhamnose 3,5-epimerase-like enzyme
MDRLIAYTRHGDERGLFLGITQGTWAEVNYIETRAGQTRGRHYHKETRELFFIIEGDVDIEIENLQTGRRENFHAVKGDIFVVEPYEMHTFHVRRDARWINMLSRKHDPEVPDFHRP